MSFMTHGVVATTFVSEAASKIVWTVVFAVAGVVLRFP
jgi:hypothetical protein